MRWWAVVAVAAALMPVGTAAAEDEAAGAEGASDETAVDETIVREDDKLLYEKETRVNFNDGQVDGELLRPEGDVVRTGPKARFKSMIQQRRDFTQELLESIDE